MVSLISVINLELFFVSDVVTSIILDLIDIDSSEVRVVFSSFEFPEFVVVEVFEEFVHSDFSKGL